MSEVIDGNAAGYHERVAEKLGWLAMPKDDWKMPFPTMTFVDSVETNCVGGRMVASHALAVKDDVTPLESVYLNVMLIVAANSHGSHLDWGGYIRERGLERHFVTTKY